MPLRIMLAAQPQERQALEAMFKQSDHSLISVNSIAEAIAGLQNVPIQVIVVDVDFEGTESGWSLAKEIRTNLALNIKVIILCRDKRQALRYFNNEKYAPLFDWILPFPISSEQLLGEVVRGLT